MIAALMDDEEDGNKLQDAAKNLADAFSNLLKAAHGSPGAPDNVSLASSLKKTLIKLSKDWLALILG